MIENTKGKHNFESHQFSIVTRSFSDTKYENNNNFTLIKEIVDIF